MQSIAETLSELRLGAPVCFKSLAVFPLFAKEEHAPDYVTLDEVLEQGLGRVTEISEGGSVPELVFDNAGDSPVLLLDGEELVGARQNRVLNLSILVGAKNKTVIPVSCVEQRRWRYVSRTFSSAKRSLYATARAQKMAQVTESMRSSGTRRSDQGRLWNSIGDKAERFATLSDTGAMADIYEQQQAKLEKFKLAIAAQDLQVGAVFAIGAKVVGAELFDAASTFRKFMARLVESYAMDAIEVDEAADAQRVAEQVQRFIADMQASAAKSFPSVGEGEDVRLSGRDLAGGALLAKGRVVHFSAFRVEAQLHGEEPVIHKRPRMH